MKHATGPVRLSMPKSVALRVGDQPPALLFEFEDIEARN
jgi:hypothetical protein